MDYLQTNFGENSVGRDSKPVPYQLCIHSGHRISGTADDYTIGVPRDTDLTQYSHVYCSSVSMVGSRLCINSENNRFYFALHLFSDSWDRHYAETYTPNNRLGRNATYCQIAEGNHTVEDIISLLNTAFRNQVLARFPATSGFPTVSTSGLTSMLFAINGPFISFTNNNNGYMGNTPFNFTAGNLPTSVNNITSLGDGAPCRLFMEFLDATEMKYYYPDVKFSNTLNSLLGFSSFPYPVYKNYPETGISFSGSRTTPWVHTSPSIYSLDCLPSLALCCDLVNSGMGSTTDGDGNTLSQSLALVATPPYGEVGLWEPNEIVPRRMVADSISQIRIFWRDASGTRVNFYGVDHSMCLTFTRQ